MRRKLAQKLVAMTLFFAGAAFGATYEVGPGMKYERITDVPLDSLEPGDIVKIHGKNEPYREKFIIRRSGTKDHPIFIRGVIKEGKRPVIDGSNAVQIQREKWPQSGRWLIKLGDGAPASHVRIESLHLLNANNSQLFVEQRATLPYEDNAAGVFVRLAESAVIYNCIIHSCGNGVQTSYGPDVNNVILNNCLIYDNGNHLDLSRSQEHNVYLCGTNTVIQFCRFGEPHSDGNNIKERGLDTLIRYNWIQGGKNRQLDLVDHEGYRQADAYVYGNVIMQGSVVHNNNMIHWGGDSGHSRSGTLYLFNNTIISTDQNARFLVIRHPDCKIEIKNNVFAGNGTLWKGTGKLMGANNWFLSTIKGIYGSLGWMGSSPGFCTVQGIPYMPCPTSSLINAGTSDIPKPLEYMPNPKVGGFQRPRDRRIDIGAYELPIKIQTK